MIRRLLCAVCVGLLLGALAATGALLLVAVHGRPLAVAWVPAVLAVATVAGYGVLLTRAGDR